MKYMLLDYVKESGWPEIPREEQERWLGVYRAYMKAMSDAGVLRTSGGLYPTPSATSVRTVDGALQVLDGPFAETKEQLGGFHIIEVPDLDAALEWARRSPTALHGTVEVRPLRDGTLLTNDLSIYLTKK